MSSSDGLLGTDFRSRMAALNGLINKPADRPSLLDRDSPLLHSAPNLGLPNDPLGLGGLPLFDRKSPLQTNSRPSLFDRPLQLTDQVDSRPSLFDKPLQLTDQVNARPSLFDRPLQLTDQVNSRPSLFEAPLQLTDQVHSRPSLFDKPLQLTKQLNSSPSLFDRPLLKLKSPRPFEQKAPKPLEDARGNADLFKKSPLELNKTPKLFDDSKDLALRPSVLDKNSPLQLNTSDIAAQLYHSPSVLVKNRPKPLEDAKDLGLLNQAPGRPSLGLFDPAPRLQFEIPKGTADHQVASPTNESTTRRRFAPTAAQSKLPGVSRQALLAKKLGDPDEQYQFIRKLGEGAFGVTCLVKNKVTGQERCLKIVSKSKSQVPPEVLEQEFQALALIDHPHVIRLFEFWEDHSNFYFVTEAYKGGTLLDVIEDHLRQRKPIDETWLAEVFGQSLEGIAYCHERKLIHKDLKSENIMLLDKENSLNPSSVHCVIIDLGLAECFDMFAELEVAGTPTTMAPELWRAAMGMGTFGPMCDIYSLGCVLFRMLSRDGVVPVMPKGRRAPPDWLEAIKRGPDWSQIAHASREVNDLVRKMLAYHEVQRPDALACLKHPWFVKMRQRMVVPSARMSKDAEALMVGAKQKRNAFENRVLMMVASQMGTGELQDVNKIFRKYDVDNNGTLSISEVISMLKDLGVTESAAREAAKAMDISKDGSIDYTEFVTACISSRKSKMRDLLKQAFDQFDVNGDGRLSREEARKVLLGPMRSSDLYFSNAEVDAMLKDMHVDNTMTFEEFADLFIPH